MHIEPGTGITSIWQCTTCTRNSRCWSCAVFRLLYPHQTPLKCQVGIQVVDASRTQMCVGPLRVAGVQLGSSCEEPPLQRVGWGELCAWIDFLNGSDHDAGSGSLWIRQRCFRLACHEHIWTWRNTHKHILITCILWMEILNEDP